MGEAKFNASVFSRHLKVIQDAWNADPAKWGGVSALVLGTGKESNTGEFPTTSTLYSFLFQFELPDTILVITKSKVWIATGPKKVRMMEEMTRDPNFSSSVPLEIHPLNGKDQTSSAAPYTALWSSLATEGGPVLLGAMDNDLARAHPSLNASITDANATVSSINTALADLLVIKDEAELKCTQTSSSISKAVLKKIAVVQVERAIDAGKSVQHHALAEEIVSVFQTPEKIASKLADSTFVDCGLSPLIQSGGKYSLAGPIGDNDSLHAGCILIELGSRFKSYCSIVGRTYFVDAPDFARKTYNFTYDLFNKLLDMIQAGTEFSSVYDAAVAHIKQHKPELLPHFVKDCGASIGLENRETPYIFDSSCKMTLKKDMVVTLRVGFENVTLQTKKKVDPKWKKFSTLITDTIRVTTSSPELLTDSPKKFSDINYNLKDASEGEEDEDKPKKKSKPSAVKKDPSKMDIDDGDYRSSNQNGDAGSEDEEEVVEVDVVPRGRTTRAALKRAAGVPETEIVAAESRRQIHQKELSERQQAECKARYENWDPTSSITQTILKKDYISYSSPKDLPAQAPRGRIFIDSTSETVLLPIYGQLVPFHIMTIKTATKQDNYLKLTFRHPESNQVANQFRDPKATFVKEVLYRIGQPEKLSSYYTEITALKKRVTDRETRKAVEDSLAVQEPLLKPNGGPKLSHLNVRPALGGRKTIGVLETHPNGFRFTTNKKAVLDITFKNIKHAFFQPAQNDAIILIHLHLHQAIMVGKKKTVDVQFYTEVSESTQIAGKTGWGDADEIEQEQMERQMLYKLNKQFANFCEQTKAHTRDAISFDTPFRNLGFHGTYGKDSVYLMPTTNCLVSLIIAPFLIVTLDEVEMVYFERVQFSLKNFDMVFVLKDYSKPTIHVTSIPSDSLDSVKEWLNSCDVRYFEGPVNLQWKKLLKEIQADPKGFWEEGGWDTFEMSDSEEEEEEESSEDEQAPAPVNASKAKQKAIKRDEEEDFEPDSSASEDYAYAESESSDSYGGSDEEGDYEEEDEDGEDWDEAEQRLRNEDDKANSKRRKREEQYSEEEEEEDDDPRPKKKAKR